MPVSTICDAITFNQPIGAIVSKTEFVVVFTTVDSLEKAESLASTCVEQQLVACVQIDGPITSVYRWEGRVETSLEYRLGMKTSASLVDSLSNLIAEVHTYDLPEIIVLPIVSGSEKYLSWMRDSLSR